MDSGLALLDITANWFVFTPLVNLFWFGTWVLIDVTIYKVIDSKLTAALLTFFLGACFEFAVTYWQEALKNKAEKLKAARYILFTRYYNYALATANILHYRGAKDLFDIWAEGGDAYTLAVAAAATTMALLWALGAIRNIGALPFSLSNDWDAATWFDASTIRATTAEQRIMYILDVFLTIFGIYSLGPLHWVTLTYFYDHVIYPEDAQQSIVASFIFGYFIVAAATYFTYIVKQWSIEFENKNQPFMKTLVENTFLTVATAGVILVWKGWGMLIELLAAQNSLVIADFDVTAIVAILVSFFLLSACHVSASLVAKGADMDGSIRMGEGVEFSRKYFREFFSSNSDQYTVDSKKAQ